MSSMSFLNRVFQTAVASLEAAIPRPAADWVLVAPPGAGFSVDAPGQRLATKDRDNYAYRCGHWSLAVMLYQFEGTHRAHLLHADRHALEHELQLTLESTLRVWEATGHSDVTRGTLNGHPTLRFSFEDHGQRAFTLLAATGERLYQVMAIGPKRSSTVDAQDFIRSFRIVNPIAPFRA